MNDDDAALFDLAIAYTGRRRSGDAWPTHRARARRRRALAAHRARQAARRRQGARPK